MKNHLQLHIINELSELERIRPQLDDFYAQNSLHEDVIFAVDLALDEILTNNLMYAFTTDQQGQIGIHLGIDSNFATLVIEDNGRPFNPLKGPEADTESGLQERPIGGLGLLLTKKFMDELHYEHRFNRNLLILKKKI